MSRRALALAVALAAVGCAGADEDTAARLRWSIGGLSCRDAGVKTVHVFLGPLGPGAYDRDIDCALGETAAVVLPGVRPGRYAMLLKGFGEDRVRYVASGDVEVDAAGEIVVVLEPYVDP